MTLDEAQPFIGMGLLAISMTAIVLMSEDYRKIFKELLGIKKNKKRKKIKINSHQN